MSRAFLCPFSGHRKRQLEGLATLRPTQQYIRHASDHLEKHLNMVMHKSRGYSFAPHCALRCSAKAAYAA